MTNKSVKPVFVIAAVLILFIGGIGATKLIGIYSVTPAKVTSETKITIEEIKGYMTLEEVSIGLKMDLNEVYKKLDLPTSIPKDTKLKDIKNTVPDFETEVAREKLK